MVEIKELTFKHWFGIIFAFLIIAINVIERFWKCVTFIGTTYILLALSYNIGRSIYKYLHRNDLVSAKKRAVLITGCDSGFGHMMALRLHRMGYRVYAACLFSNGQGAQDLQNASNSQLKVVQLDVTNDDQIKEAVAFIESDLKESGHELWALVNNAGIMVFDLFENAKGIELMLKQFEVNVFGLAKITRLCLPLLRRSKGRIVNLSSIAGRESIRWLTTYSMSKHAVHSFNEGLRQEVAPFGIKVIAVEPWAYKTALMDMHRLKQQAIERFNNEASEEVKAAYGAYFEQGAQNHATILSFTSNPNIGEVLDALTNAVTLADPEVVYKCCGIQERVGSYVFSHFNDSFKDIAVKYLNAYGLFRGRRQERLAATKKQ